MDKLELNMDATSLGTSACLQNYKFTVIDGYKVLPKDIMIYGVSGHKFVDTMFKTESNFALARQDAWQSFSVPKVVPFSKTSRTWISDKEHLMAVCYNLWEDVISKDTFEMLELSQDCYWCKGEGKIDTKDVYIP